MLVAGIDEAGKGPVIGPLCIGGVLMDEARVSVLKNLGVADSKKLTPGKRETLSHQIKKYASKVFVLEVSSSQIDELRRVMSMNDIMIRAFSIVLDELHPDQAFVDAADVNENRFGERLVAEYEKKHPERAGLLTMVSKHRADAACPVVSAASIIAKVHRDNAITKLKKDLGIDLGSGYPSDPKTKKFLLDWLKEHDDFPDFVRHSWKTAEEAKIKAAELRT